MQFQGEDMAVKIFEQLKSMKLWEFVISTALAMTFTLTFITAYFDPMKSVEVTINSIGEANIELVMLTFYWIIFFMNKRWHDVGIS